MTLHERLLAEIEQREKVSREATPGPWQHVDYADPEGQPMTSYGLPSTYMGCGSVITMGENVAGRDIAAPNGDLYPRGGYSPLEDMRHIALHDPGDALLRYAHHRKVLERHYQGRDEAGYPTCVECECADFECWYLLGLADSLGVPIEEEP